MMFLNRLWKTKWEKNNFNRYIKEVNLNEINLKDYTVVDVRSRREFREGHINGALNIPLPEVKRNIEKYVPNKEKKILVCCSSGTRSKKAIETMENLGYKELYNLKGGLENI